MSVEASVVVATRNRAARLPRLVAALEAQTLAADRFEVVIVDDASGDDTGEVLAELVRRSPLALRSLSTDRRGGPGVARNVGWRATRAPVVAFTDDDCVPQPRWLETGLDALDDRHRVVIGRTLPAPDQEHRRGPFSRVIRVESIQLFEACNIFYRREDLQRAGGFDPAFRNSGEDVDLGWRVTDAGAEAVYAPDAVVHHDIRPSRLWPAVVDRQRGDGIPLLFARHPDRRGEHLWAGVFWTRTHAYTLSAVIGVLGARRWSGLLALALPWLWHRSWTRSAGGGPARRIGHLPGLLLIDLSDVLAMVRGSVRAGTVVL